MDNGSFALHSVVALVLGMIIGFERQWRQHTAGLRTNALVALGAAMFVSLSLMTHLDGLDADHPDSPTRVASYVVSGLGFLGGGVILREGLTVQGMNTAATIWCSGAIGSLAGSGFLIEATIGTGAILFVHIVLRPFALWIEAYQSKAQMVPHIETYYRIRVSCRCGEDALPRSLLLRQVGASSTMSLKGLSATEDASKRHTVVVADIFASKRNDHLMEELVRQLCGEPQVTAVSWQQQR